MDLSALVARFRTLSGDRAVPPLWPTRDVVAFFNEAEREAAERGRLLYERLDPAMTRIEMIPGQRDYRLHPALFDVEVVAIHRPGSNGQAHRNLVRCNREDMQWSLTNRPNLSGWADNFLIYGDASGDGAEGKHLVIDRLPAEAGGVLVLEGYRYPREKMADPGDEPEIAARHHDALVHWALAVAYRTRDMEGDAEQRALRHEAEFAARFGERPDANVLRKHVERRRPVVRAKRW